MGFRQENGFVYVCQNLVSLASHFFYRNFLGKLGMMKGILQVVFNLGFKFFLLYLWTLLQSLHLKQKMEVWDNKTQAFEMVLGMQQIGRTCSIFEMMKRIHDNLSFNDLDSGENHNK